MSNRLFRRSLNAKHSFAAAAFVTAVGLVAPGTPAMAGAILSAPGIVPTTQARLTTGFLVPRFESVPARPEYSKLFYGYDQGAETASQPSWFLSKWKNLPAITPTRKDGSSILVNTESAAPQLSINQFEGLTIRGELTDFAGGIVPPNPVPNARPVVGYPLAWQFNGQGNIAQCAELALNVKRQAFEKYLKWQLAAEKVPTRFYEGPGYRVEPGQDTSFKTTRTVSISQTVHATAGDIFSVSAKPADQAEIRNDVTGEVGSATEARVTVSYEDTHSYHNGTNKIQYYWVGSEADYYVALGLPYVFWKPDFGPVLAQYPDGIGPTARKIADPKWKGGLGRWVPAEMDPAAKNKLNLSFDWLPKGHCYVGQTLSLAKVLYPNKGFYLVAEEPWNYGH
ncbi:hypothetical protein D5S17_00765 [Pseudonocardiaceae bacterium YIM PH 21723]|nr:hypothetical protein D5S17_00765 [Pseudonocardiaceae bacterium YIM PH 21723]